MSLCECVEKRIWRGVCIGVCVCKATVHAYWKSFVLWQPCVCEHLAWVLLCVCERERQTELMGSLWRWVEGKTAELSLSLLAFPPIFLIFLSSPFYLSPRLCLCCRRKQCAPEMCAYGCLESWLACANSVCVCACEHTVYCVRRCVLCEDIWGKRSRTGVLAVSTSFSQDGAALQSSATVLQGKTQSSPKTMSSQLHIVSPFIKRTDVSNVEILVYYYSP